MSDNAPTQDYEVAVTVPETALDGLAQDVTNLESFYVDSAALVRLGESLFRLMFPTPDAVRDLAVRLASAVRAGATLRLWLRVEEAGSALPWEFLCLTTQAVAACKVEGYDAGRHLPDGRLFLALHPNVSIVRHGGDVAVGDDLTRIGKLRVLVAWADPGSPCWEPIAGLSVEVENVRRALAELPSSHVVVDAVENATPESLARRMREFRPHVLHYAGHGAYPLAGSDIPSPSLVLEGAHDKERRHAYLRDDELRVLCAEVGVQVVVLNSCWGGKQTPQFGGLARSLTSGERRVPVVVAHQMPVPQAAAAGFARPFYEKLVVGCPVEEGVAAYRRECAELHPKGASAPDWGIPVVHLGARRTHLFLYQNLDPYPIDFGPLIRDHVPIVGRKFLHEALDKFMAERDGGVFLLTAPPGIGKTAFLSQLVEDDPTRAHHFYRAAGGMTDPDECVKSLYRGLLARHGIVEKDATNDRGELRTRLKTSLMQEVSRRCVSSGRSELILLDALDESGTTAADNKSALDVLPERMPSRVFLLITSRPGPLAERCAQRADVHSPFALDPASADNRADAAAFCVRELRGRVHDADEPALEQLGKMLAERAEGNFLVLKLFLKRESLGERPTAEVVRSEAAELSGDVRNEYEVFFTRVTKEMANDREGMKLLNRVLGAITTSRAPVTEEQVRSAFAVDVEDWEWSLLRARQFLAGGGLRQEERGVMTYRIYHETFREFLRDRLKSRLKEFDERWAEYTLEWRKLKGYSRLYALRHVVGHLVAAGREGA